jgi:multiple sugar transport system substrate-binding protein
LAAAGIKNVPEPPALTWNPENGGTLVKIAQELTVDSSGKHPGQAGFNPAAIVRYGFLWTDSLDDSYNLTAWLHSNGGTVQTPSGTLAIDSPQNVQTITFIKDLSDKYYVSPPYTALAASTPFSLFAANRAAIWYSGDWELAALLQQSKFKMEIGLNPAGADGSWTRSNPLSDSVYSGSTHQAAAFLFAEYVSSATAQNMIGKTGIEFPATAPGDQLFLKYWAQRGVDAESYVVATHKNGDRIATDPVLNNFNQFYDVWVSTMTKILSNSLPVQGGLVQLQQAEEKITGLK